MSDGKLKADATPSPADINQRLADAWNRMATHYEHIAASNRGVWNKTNHLGLLDFFLDRHNELKQQLPAEYGKSEQALVEAALARARESERLAPMPVELDLTMLTETEQKAACWRELLATYCRIHGRLKKEWMPWAEEDYREFLEVVSKLRELETLKNKAART
jgi:hypothetical protein